MKKHIVRVVLAVALLCLCAAQNYKLYPTKGTNLFIKLDTRNGTMTQVQSTVDDSANRFELTLNDIPLVAAKEQKTGRFELYPTPPETITGIFILLDTLAGSCWRVEHTKGTVVPFELRGEL